MIFLTSCKYIVHDFLIESSNFFRYLIKWHTVCSCCCSPTFCHLVGRGGLIELINPQAGLPNKMASTVYAWAFLGTYRRKTLTQKFSVRSCYSLCLCHKNHTIALAPEAFTLQLFSPCHYIDLYKGC